MCVPYKVGMISDCINGTFYPYLINIIYSTLVVTMQLGGHLKAVNFVIVDISGLVLIWFMFMFSITGCAQGYSNITDVFWLK